jgi:hypothetical protein
MLTVFDASLPISELSEHLMQCNTFLVEKADL